tara:strand:- start:16485 stop:16799 length:315 start_codon:yes stop_codon:yes gene_type:complete
MGWTQLNETGSTFTPVDITASQLSTQQQFLDDTYLWFGTDFDYGIQYKASTNQLCVSHTSGGTHAIFDSGGINSLVFSEQSSLPTAVEGSIVYVNNGFYLGLGS